MMLRDKLYFIENIAIIKFALTLHHQTRSNNNLNTYDYEDY